MTNEQYSAAKARLEAATPAPWYATYNIECGEPEDERVGNWYVSLEEDAPFRGRTSESFVADFVHKEDAIFIGHAPEDLRLALAEIERRPPNEMTRDGSVYRLVRSTEEERAQESRLVTICGEQAAEIYQLRRMEARLRSLSDQWRKKTGSPAHLGVDSFERDACLNACADDLEAIVA
jgi:hypothetical protein